MAAEKVDAMQRSADAGRGQKSSAYARRGGRQVSRGGVR
jgi:hypothetical protein